MGSQDTNRAAKKRPQHQETPQEKIRLLRPDRDETMPNLAIAIFNAVGARVRSLPITADAVKAAMKA
jgi:hypothetical protein